MAPVHQPQYRTRIKSILARFTYSSVNTGEHGVTRWIETVSAHLCCVEDPAYMDTLTGQDTQSVTLSAHLKLSCTNLRGPIATHPTLSGFLFRGVRRGLSQSCSESGRGCVVGTGTGSSQRSQSISHHAQQSNSVVSVLHSLPDTNTSALPPQLEHPTSPCSLPIPLVASLCVTLVLAYISYGLKGSVWIFHRGGTKSFGRRHI